MSLTKAMFIVMAMVYPLSWLATAFDGNKKRNLSKTKDLKAIILILIIFVIIFVFAGCRHVSGSAIDEYAYRNRVISYRSLSFGEALKNIEWLSAIPTWIMSQITRNSQSIIIFDSLVTYSLFVYCIKKYCDNFELGILLMFLLNLVNLSFNAMQQVEAASVLMLGIPYLYKKDFKKYLLIVILASLIHISSIVMLALYFIANIKPWSFKFIGVSVLFIFLMMIFNTVSVPIFNALGIYDNYIDVLKAGGGVKAITVIVAFIPIGMALAFKKYLPEDDREMNCLTNMVMIYAMIYLVASQQRFIGRFAIFLLPWLIPFYCKLITYLRKERLSVIIYYVLLIGYGATTIYFTSSLKYELMLGG